MAKYRLNLSFDIDITADKDEVRPPTQFAKEIIEDYKLAVQKGEISRGED